MKICVIGAGVIGAGWIARFVLNGFDVAVFDTDQKQVTRVEQVLELARKSLPHLYDRIMPKEGKLVFHDNLKDAVSNADWVQESLPENLKLKHKVFAEALLHVKDGGILASSTSGFKPSDLRHGLKNRDGKTVNIVVAHPFQPVYLLPLVEIVLPKGEGDNLYPKAEKLMHSVGMHPMRIREEIDGHVADRLLEALWREALWLVNDGIATTEEIDQAICLGFGLRWAQMGLFETYRIGGGDGGMRQFMLQFGPALKWPWTKLMDTPDLTEELVDKIVTQSDTQSGGKTIRELESLRDKNLVGIMRILKSSGSGAGAVINRHEETMEKVQVGETETLPTTASLYIPSMWIDANGHMNEVYYLEISNRATVSFLEEVGVDDTYIQGGGGYFAVETKLQYVQEVLEGTRVEVKTQVLELSGKKLRLYHAIKGKEGVLHCGIETLLLHIDMVQRKSSEPPNIIYDKLVAYAKKHEGISIK